MKANEVLRVAASLATTQPLLVTLIGVALSAAVAAWVAGRDERRGLTVVVQSASLLADTTGGPVDLAFSFRGKPVSGLVRIDLVLQNSGRQALFDRDVVVPPTVRIDSGTILQAEVEGRSPQSLEASISVDSSRRAVALRTPLLNAEDHLDVVLYVASNRIPRLTGSVHAAGISNLAILDHRPSTKSKTLQWSPEIAAFIVGELLLLVFFAVTMAQIGYERRARKVWNGGEIQLRPPVPPFAFAARVNELFADHPGLRHNIENQLSRLDPTRAMPEDLFYALKAEVVHYADSLRKKLRIAALVNAVSLLAGALVFLWAVWAQRA